MFTPPNIYVCTYFPADRLLTIKSADKKMREERRRGGRTPFCVLCVYVSTQDILSRSGKRKESVVCVTDADSKVFLSFSSLLSLQTIDIYSSEIMLL